MTRRRDNSPHVRQQAKAGGSEASLDAWFANGYESSLSLATYDDYPSLADDDTDDYDVGLAALNMLSDELRFAIETTVVGGMSYAEAADYLRWWLSDGTPDRKRVKRARDRGLAEVASIIAEGCLFGMAAGSFCDADNDSEGGQPDGR